jgi:subtilisin family serine protease
VDANSLLDGRVEVGREFVTSGSAAGDCVGHGTMAAGLIAASSQAGGLGGMAPQATILSEKVTNTESIPNVNSVIQAIGAAVSAHVQVINMSLGITMDLPEGVSASSTPICQAVDTAMAANIVVVAAAGNIQTNSKGQVTAAGPFYPASCRGVLSVGAVNQDGSLASFSSVKSAVDVTAPGVNMKSTFPGTNGDSFAVGQGTSFSAPLVAGLAALVRARYPQLSQAQVIQRIEQTADGSEGPGTGNGLINPVQALTAVLPAESNSRSTSVVINRPATNGTQKTITLALTGGAVAMVVIVLAAAVVIPAGRRRRWRPGGLS